MKDIIPNSQSHQQIPVTIDGTLDSTHLIAPTQDNVIKEKIEKKGHHDILEKSIEESSKSETLYAADSPQVPKPSLKGLQRLALRGDIKNGAIKSQETSRLINQQSVVAAEPGDLSPSDKAKLNGEQNTNLWLRYPSSMGALYAALQIYRENLVKSRIIESENRIQVRENIYDAGIDTANTQEEATLKQATKEQYDAWNKAATGVMSAYQAHSQIAAAAEEKEKIEANDPEYQKKKNTVDELTEKETKKVTILLDDVNKSPELKAAELELSKAKMTLSSRISDATRQRTSLIDLQYRSLNSFLDAGFSMIRSQVTTEEAALQKSKAMLDALIQAMSKTEETVSRAKEEAYSEMQKIDQLTTELSKSRVSIRC